MIVEMENCKFEVKKSNTPKSHRHNYTLLLYYLLYYFITAVVIVFIPVLISIIEYCIPYHCEFLCQK